MASFVRIMSLLWADMVTLFAIYVMMNYLTDVWNLSVTHASGIINIWNGITPALIIVFAVFADTFMSHFYMLGFSSISYSIGLGLLAMSTPPVFGPCSDYKVECIGHTQKVLFYIALPLISVGMAGHFVSIGPFSRQQSENENEKNREEAESKSRNENESQNAIEKNREEVESKSKNQNETSLEEAENESKNGIEKNRGEDENESKNESQNAIEKKGEEDENERKNENKKNREEIENQNRKGNEKKEEKGENESKSGIKNNQEETETEKLNIKPMQAKGFFMVIGVLIVGGIGLPYIKPWSLRFGIPAICSVVATLWFFTGCREYSYKRIKSATESPLTTLLRVFVASASRISQPLPDPEELYNEEKVHSTSTLRCLNKAAVKLPQDQHMKKWKVCSVREVEDAKIGIRMIPVWLTFIIIGIVLSIGNTYFLEQANHMDRKLGKLTIPIPFFLLFYKATCNVSVSFYSLLTKIFNKKYAPPIGIATSMVFAVLCCITAAKVETRRLHRIRDHGLLDKPDEKIPMSIFALLPQFMLLAAVDGIANRSITGFFRHQTPESMHKYLTYFTNGVLGLGSMASVLSVYVVGRVSERNDKPNWFQYTLNMSRLDRYYMVLAGLSAVNLVIYVIVAYFYKYKESLDGGDDEDDEVEGVIEEGFEDKKCCCF